MFQPCKKIFSNLFTDMMFIRLINIQQNGEDPTIKSLVIHVFMLKFFLQSKSVMQKERIT